MSPDYEVKLLLDPAAVLGSDHKLTSTVLSTFGMPSSVTKMNVQFLDTDSKEIYMAGWSPRIRKIEDEDDFELTYKKRYAITGGDINAELTRANHDGFDAGDTRYEAQVDWGYEKQTLSISRKKSASDDGYPKMDLPGTNDSRAMLINKALDKFNDWMSNKNWGTGALARSRIFGPILAKRSIGKWSGLELFIEVWPIRDAARTGTEYIVEASFKTTIHTTAATERDSLATYLEGKGWLLKRDSLRTQLIMERY